MLISLSLLWRQQAFSTLPSRLYPKHFSSHLPIRSFCSHSSSMAHPITSSGSLQIPALESQHTDGVSNKEPKSQKEKKSKTVPASQFPLEVRCHPTVIACSLTHYSSHKLQPPPGFFDHRVKIFEGLKAEYDVFVQGLLLPSHAGIKLTIASTTASGNYYYVTRWRGAHGHKLGDQSDGCCEGHIQESA
jgi:hypothetical protein